MTIAAMMIALITLLIVLSHLIYNFWLGKKSNEPRDHRCMAEYKLDGMQMDVTRAVTHMSYATDEIEHKFEQFRAELQLSMDKVEVDVARIDLKLLEVHNARMADYLEYKDNMEKAAQRRPVEDREPPKSRIKALRSNAADFLGLSSKINEATSEKSSNKSERHYK